VEMIPELKKAATALKGAVKVGALDADKHRVIAKRFDVSEVPQVMIFSGIYSFPYFESRTATALSEAGLSEVYNKVKEQLREVTKGDKM
jgi:protein disulfide-isomerase A6